MAIAKRIANRGFTLIELMIVVVIIGILAALAIYGVSQYVTNAKTAEARTAVGRMGKDSLNAFESEQMTGSVMSLGSLRSVSRRLCASVTALVPAAIQAEGDKYQPRPSDFRVATDTPDIGWRCLGFTMDQPINFQYGYNASMAAGTQAAAGQTAIAYGQANLGGAVRFIGQTMAVQQETATSGFVLTLAPSLSEAQGAKAVGLDTTVP